MSTHYEILQVSVSASNEEIKQSYRKLAKEHHPDKGGNKEVFQKIQISYEILSDENKRREYDFSLNRNKIQIPFPLNFNNTQNFPFNLFQFINERNTRPQIKKPDEIYDCKVSLNEVFNGCSRNFCIKRKSKCESCSVECHSCKGSGFTNSIPQRIQIGQFMHVNNSMCMDCHGNGLLRKIECANCSNTGFVIKEKNIELFIPKGVENGKQYFYEGWGEQAFRNNEVSGNFIVKISLIEHEHFERVGLNLIYNTTISLKESLLGKYIIIPYFNQPFVFDTSSIGIINPNKEYVIINKGLQDEIGNIGNLLIKFKIDYKDTKFSDDKRKELINLLNEVDF